MFHAMSRMEEFRLFLSRDSTMTKKLQFLKACEI